MASETVSTTPAPRRLPWMLILFVPRLAFYMFMAVRDFQFWQYAQHAHGLSASDRHSIPTILTASLAVFVVFVEGLIWGAARFVVHRRHEEEKKRAKQAAEAEEIAREPLQPIAVNGLVLQPNEHAYLRQTVQLFGQHTVTQRQGRYSGASVRVPGTHGALRLNAGGFASAPVSRTAMVSEGSVDLVLTNDRILLLSLGGNSTHTLRDVIGIAPFTDGVRIDFSHGRPLIAISGDQRLGLLVQRVLHETQRL